MIDQNYLRFLQGLPGFPAAMAPPIQAMVDDDAAGPDADLYGPPSSYTPRLPQPGPGTGVVRTHGGVINPAETQAAVIRGLERDYQQRFVPIENQIVGEVMNRGAGLSQDLARSRRSVIDAAQNVEGQRRRAASRFGVARSMDPDNQTDTVSNAISAARDTRLRVEDRRLGLMGGTSNIAAQSKPNYGE